MRPRTLPAGPARLLVDGRDVAPALVAATRAARGRGLLGRDGFDGALVLWPAASVHTFAMRFAIDVAACDRAGRVRWVATLPPGRLTRPRPFARFVVEAEAGAFARWSLAPGAHLALDPSP